MTSEPTENPGIGQYQPGLNQSNESVISAHFMHRQNESDARLYDAGTLARESVSVSPLDVKNILIPMLKEASREVITKRSEAAKERARRNFQQYDLVSPNNIGAAEEITEVLFDNWFSKGSMNKADRIQFRNRIKEIIDNGEPIQMAIPMLPNKSPCPLKSRGQLPCVAEAGLLARLGEVAGIVNKLYHDGKPQTADQQMAKFIVVGDGRRFMNNDNTPETVVESYQRALKWWLKQLDLESSVAITDYEHMLEKNLTSEQKQERKKLYQDALKQMTSVLGDLLDPMDMETSFKRAIKADPYPDDSHPEGRFVPLFKSTIYSIHYDILRQITDTKLLGENEYALMYRELTRHIFKPYVDIGEDDCERIRAVIRGEKQEGSDTPPKATVLEVKEYVRRRMLKEAWNATIDYLALVVADRAMLDDPVIQGMPNAIRYSIHLKPGQIPLAPDSSSSGAVQAWHGASILRPSGSKIKFSNDSALNAEGLGAKPVMVRRKDGDSRAHDSEDVLEQFADSNQPLFYVHPSIQFYDTPELQKQFTRCK